MASKSKRSKGAAAAAKARDAHTKGIYLRGGTYWLNFQRHGKRHFISLETADFATACQRAHRLRYGPELAAKQGMEADIEAFFSAKKRLNVCSRQTERVHRAALMEFVKCHTFGIAVRDIRPSSVSAHYERLQARVAETTAQIHMRALRSFFSWCVETHRCAENPVKAVKLARVDKPARLRFCTKAERDHLIATAPDDDLRFILYCGFHCGLRKGEIIEARTDWFDLAGGSCHIQNTDTFRVKDRDSRHVPLTQAMKEFLATYLCRDELKGSAQTFSPKRFALKPNVKQGRHIYRYDFHKPYMNHVRAQGLPWVTAHVMRHTFASIAVQSNVSIFKVARWLGDGVEVVEKHYAHLSPNDPDIERTA